jgi:hypothetical protein
MLIYYCLSRQNYRNSGPNVLHLILCTNGHVRSWTVTPYQRSRVDYELFDRNQKCVGEVTLRFQLELNTQGVLSSRIKMYRNEVRRTWGLYLENYLRTYIDMIFFPRLSVGVLYHEFCPNNLKMD